MLCNLFKVTAVVKQLRDVNISSVAVKPGRPDIRTRGQIDLALRGQNVASHCNALKKLPSEDSDSTCKENKNSDVSLSSGNLQSTSVKCAAGLILSRVCEIFTKVATPLPDN